ncbi:MAG: DUF3160 domain-containing protein, partial [Candidatus Obscuribacterales bacterium]|nr:DUF3160 domain-containing protein [Candidatus Obscuribacterales bacterium]
RAVLLYRSLTIAKIDGEPALSYWHRVGNAYVLLGMNDYARLKTILPTDLAPVMTKANKDFGKLLEVLSQPFLRTKLLLSVRKERPVQLGSTSIFEVSRKRKEDDADVIRFFPLVEPTELMWINEIARTYVPESNTPTPTPLALLALHAHGAPLATNLLSMQTSTLDPRLISMVPRLEHVLALSRGGKASPEVDNRWQIISGLLGAYPDTAQIALRSNLWLMRQLESAISAWVDSYLAYIPLAFSPVLDATTNSEQSQSTGGNNKQSGKASFHYLEPRPLVYRMVASDCQLVMDGLARLDITVPAYLKRGQDFLRLYQRLEAVAEKEIKGEPISKADFVLLSNIDQVLAPVDSPLPGTLYFSDGKVVDANKDGDSKEKGMSLGLGKAGRLYIICVTTQGATLCRGAVYNYYEVGGGPIRQEHWLRKLDYGLLRQPIWASQFDFVQEAPGS